MRDLLIITPTRERLQWAQRLRDAVVATCTAETDLVFCVDEDDHSYDGADYSPAEVVRGQRRDCIRWTNHVALERWKDYRALASFGDDHVPETRGWDSLLLKAIDDLGGTGISYGDDTLQGPNLPTAPVVSSDIVGCLGWFMHAKMGHYRCDDVWLNLARPDLLRYVPEVIIRHHHYAFGLAPRDEVYASAEKHWGPDYAEFLRYQHDPTGLEGDREKIRQLAR